MIISGQKWWQHILGVIAVNLVWGAPGQAWAGPDRALIQVYNGFGTPAGAMIWGRALEDEGIAPPRRRDGWMRKLKRNFHALESDELPRAVVELTVLGRKHRVRADKEGLFQLELKGPLKVGRHRVKARLIADKKGRQLPSRQLPGELLVAPAGPGVAVISDIDDTVLDSGVEHKLRLAKRVLTTSAYDLKTFPGAPALYRSWSRRGLPLVFVSGSPVNLYPKLTRFFELQRFPVAPMLLKDFGFKDLTDQRAYKLGQLATVLRLLPGYRFILVGDDGEQDPEIYAALQAKHPRRVEAVLIHKVAEKPKTAPKGQLHFADYRKLARQLARRRAHSGGAAAAGGKRGGAR